MSGTPGWMRRSAILVTGDEVLGGRVRDRNGPYLTRDLLARGVIVERIVFVGDRLDELGEALTALARLDVDLICVTGGLGPTADDRSMDAVARFCGVPLEVDAGALAMVDARSRGISRGRATVDELAAMRRKQAMLPRGATVLPPVGTAPGCVARRGGTTIVVLPGPPFELTRMWTAAVTDGPLAGVLPADATPTARTFRLWWVFEADLMSALGVLPGDVVERVGTYTREGELEVVVPMADAPAVEAVLRDAFGAALFASDGDEVGEMIARRLIERGERLAVAESCTGGMLGARLTDLPGASRWFDGGVVSYADHVKTGLLGVDPGAIADAGAVSERVARAMAEGARDATGADWGVSITGIAGPDGGSDAKPVGTVWVGLAGPDGTQATLTNVRYGDRDIIRRRAVAVALHRLRIALG